MSRLCVHLLPQLVPPEALRGSTVVVIDVLRATTTIVAALAAGARAVVPCLTVDDALARAHKLGADALLAGERGGRKIEGFDLGNSPAEFTSSTVGGKTVVMTTTNGTQALLHATQAAETLIGAFANLSAVSAKLRMCAQVDIICAGTDEQVTREDVLAAGAIARRIVLAGSCEMNDAAVIAMDVWSKFAERPLLLADALRSSLGGQNLMTIGMDADIDYAAEIDRFAIVPRFDPATGDITLHQRP